jgi:hypothetical protein
MLESVENRESGQSIILVAVAMVALVIFAAVAVDLTHAYVQRRTAQNAADGAAIAGAKDLARQRNKLGKKLPVQGDPREVKAAMNDYAERNGIADTDDVPANWVNDNLTAYWLDRENNRIAEFDLSSGGKIPEGAYGVEAVSTIDAQTFFGGVVGVNGLVINAEAAVSLFAPACGAECVVPIAVYWDLTNDWFQGTSDTPDWNAAPWSVENPPPFACYNIWNGQGEGNFGWLDWRLQEIDCPVSQGNCSEPCLAYNLDPEYCLGYLSIGEKVAGTVGTKTANDVLEQLDKWIGWHPEWGISNPDAYPPQSFTLPLYEIADGTGCTGWYEVAGFAEMQLIGYQLSQGGGVVMNDPWFSNQWQDLCTICENVNVPPDLQDPCAASPNGGTRLTAFFLDYVDPSALPGECDIYGTVSTPRFVR